MKSFQIALELICVRINKIHIFRVNSRSTEAAVGPTVSKTNPVFQGFFAKPAVCMTQKKSKVCMQHTQDLLPTGQQPFDTSYPAAAPHLPVQPAVTCRKSGRCHFT